MWLLSFFFLSWGDLYNVGTIEDRYYSRRNVPVIGLQVDSVFVLCLQLEVAHAAALSAKDKKDRDTQQHCADALERERQKLIRTVALHEEAQQTETMKAIRKNSREWQTVCGNLQKALSLQQTTVVQQQLQHVRELRVALEREEVLKRTVSSLRSECSVSTIITELLPYSFYVTASMITLLCCYALLCYH
jgi:hypothetical protein